MINSCNTSPLTSTLSTDRRQLFRILLLTVAPLSSAGARAEEKEPTLILELGGASERGLSGGSSFGPSAAAEFTPIKDWLEIEAGVSPRFSAGQTDWKADLIFKKPFTLSDKVEFMIGVGPECSGRKKSSRRNRP